MDSCLCERRQVWVERSTSWRSQQPRTAEFLVHEELLDCVQQDLLPGSRRRVRRRFRDNDSEDALTREGESPEEPRLAEPTEPRSRLLVLVSSTQVDPVPPTVPDSVDGPHRRRRRVRSEGSDLGPPAVVGGAIHHNLTLIDSSDDDAPFVVSRSAASPARPSRRLVLVPESVDASPQSIQDREWDRGGVETPNTQATTVHVPPESVAEGSEWDLSGTPVGVLPRPLNGLEEDLQRPTVGVRGGHTGATMVDTDSEETDRESDAFVSIFQEVDSDEEHDRAILTRSIQAAYASLDAVDLQAEFRCRPCLMRSPFLRGACRFAMRVALTEFHHSSQDATRRKRAWTLFLLLSRLLLFRPARGGLLPKGQL